MKKYFIAVCIGVTLVWAMPVQAQSEGVSMNQFSVELNQGSSTGIAFRYHLSSALAIKISGAYDFDHFLPRDYQPTITIPGGQSVSISPVDDQQINTTSYTLGVQWNFLSMGQLIGYTGLSFVGDFSSNKITYNYKNLNVEPYSTRQTLTNTIGGALPFGLEYNVSEKFYVGLEVAVLQYGYTHEQYLPYDEYIVNDTYFENYSVLKNPLLRVGFRF